MSSSRVVTVTGAKVDDEEKEVYDVIVVGGGLSGLLVCDGLHNDLNANRFVGNSKHEKNANSSTSGNSRIHWKLLEASSHLGGRLKNAADTDNIGNSPVEDTGIDMGGAWYWPIHQPYMNELVEQRFQIPVFRQPDDLSSGTTRIDGGAVQLIYKLRNEVPQERIQYNTPVTKVEQIIYPQNSDNENEGYAACRRIVRIEASASNAQQGGDEDVEVFYAKTVIFAIPPKLLAPEYVQFDPPLSRPKRKAIMESKGCHTWMAGVTKVALVYSTPRFWYFDHSNMGLPRSTVHPAFQVYDSTCIDKAHVSSSLTFFVLDPSTKADDKLLAKQVATQLQHVWNNYYGIDDATSSRLHSYTKYYVQRWPYEPYISGYRPEKKSSLLRTVHAHPMPITALSQPEWNNRHDGDDDDDKTNHNDTFPLLYFAGTETDLTNPGVMEGAVGAAKRVLGSLDSCFSQP